MLDNVLVNNFNRPSVAAAVLTTALWLIDYGRFKKKV